MSTILRQRAVHRAARRAARLLAASALCLACHDVTATREPVVRTLEIQGNSTLSLTVGERRRLVAIARDNSGSPIPTRVGWSSDHPAIVSVDTLGTVQAILPGQALISARAGDAVATTPLLVTNPVLDLVLPDLTNAEVGDVYEATAVFRGGDGAVVDVPWDVTWKVTSAAAIEFPDPQNPRRIRLRMLAVGLVSLELSTHTLAVSRTWQVRAPLSGPPLVIERFVMFQRPSGWFVPDLVVSTTHPPVIVQRIEFSGTQPAQVACGNALLETPGQTPLFDFQPYNFSWVGMRAGEGATVKVIISANRGGRITEVSATTRVVFDPGRRNYRLRDGGIPVVRMQLTRGWHYSLAATVLCVGCADATTRVVQSERTASLVPLAASNDQTGPTGATLGIPLQVQVLVDGVAKSGVLVSWRTTSGSVTPASTLSDLGGYATATWTLGNTIGMQRTTATISQAVPAAAEFRAVAVEPVVAERIAETDGQRAVVATTLANELRVRITQNGVPKEGVLVRWSAPSTITSTSVSDALRHREGDVDHADLGVGALCHCHRVGRDEQRARHRDLVAGSSDRP